LKTSPPSLLNHHRRQDQNHTKQQRAFKLLSHCSRSPADSQKGSRAFAPVALFLALLTTNLGTLFYFGQPFVRLTSCVLGLMLIASIIQAAWRVRKRSLWPDFLLAAVGFAFMLLFLDSKEAGFIGLICALGVALTLFADEAKDEIYALLTASGLVALFDYGYSHIWLIWYGVRWANRLMMRLIEILTRQPMPFGHHASGFFILIPFLAYLVAFILHAQRADHRAWRKNPAARAASALDQEEAGIIMRLENPAAMRTLALWFDSLLMLLSLFACQGLYLITQQAIFSRLRFRVYQALFQLSPFETHWFAFLIFLVPLWLYKTRLKGKLALSQGRKLTEGYSCSCCRGGMSLGRRIVAFAFVLLILLAVQDRRTIIPCGRGRVALDRQRRVVIYDNLDWSRPKFGYYGDRSGGMFGNLPDFLSSLGFLVQLEKELDDRKLQGVDLLVVINLMERFKSPVKEAIFRYLLVGGNLLVMGDHTGLGFIREPLNDLIAPVGIKLQFDSVCPLVPSWQNCMEIRPHRITEHLSTENDIQIWIGASLEIRPPARPILIGVRAFSDAGNKDNPQEGFLGDLQYQRSEQLGDVVLVAESRLGKGKILVFGDTSSLQNGSLPYSYQFIQQIFYWLTEKASDLSLAKTPRVQAYHQPDELSINQASPRREAYRIAYIDSSHGELFDLSGWQKNSIDGLAYNLMRNRYAPFITRRLDSTLLDNSTLWVFISPTKSFSSKEQKLLHRFMAQGGMILWTSGWMVREASLSFLEDLGLSIINIPLGPVRERYGNYEVRFQDAWPIQIEHQAESKTRVVLQWGGYPLVVFQRYGRGGLVLISDSRFVLNHNLEHINNFYHEGNILFLRDIIEKIISGERL